MSSGIWESAGRLSRSVNHLNPRDASKQKWNESGFRPPLCTYRLNWVRRTYWGWWDDWSDTVLQTQHLKFEPWRSEAEHATSRSRRLPTILTFTRGWGKKKIFVSFKPPRPGTEPRTLAWKAAVLTTTLVPRPMHQSIILRYCRAVALGQWLAPLPFTLEFGVRFPVSAVWKKQKYFFQSTHKTEY